MEAIDRLIAEFKMHTGQPATGESGMLGPHPCGMSVFSKRSREGAVGKGSEEFLGDGVDEPERASSELQEEINTDGERRQS